MTVQQQSISVHSPKFTLPLQAHSQRKRILEAKHKLADLYPFEIDADHLLVLKTDKKGEYEVYIAKEKIEKAHNNKKILLLILLFLCIGFSLSLVLHHIAIKNSQSLQTQKELERQKLEEAKIKKEKQDTLAQLKKEYDEKMSLHYERIYPYLECIYCAMTPKSTIENITIDKNIFSVEVTTKNAVDILSNFEESKAFRAVKMNRTTVKDGSETVIYEGEFSRYREQADDNLSLDAKIVFYKDALDRMAERSEILRNTALSEYIKNIRSVLHTSGCHEQYIQLKGKDKNAQVEFFILSTSASILRFITEIQKDDDTLIDIKSFHIRNSENQSRLQTTICFDTGIELTADDVAFTYQDTRIRPSDIEGIFYKSPVVKPTPSKTGMTQTPAQVKKSMPNSSTTSLKKVSYIGLTKTGGREYVIVKDDDMGSIHKLILSKTETSGDCCVMTDGLYRAKIHSEYYEVKK